MHRQHSISIVGYPPTSAIVGRPSIVSSAGNISLGSSPTTISEEIRSLSHTLQNLAKRKDIPESALPNNAPQKSSPTLHSIERNLNSLPNDLAEALVPASTRMITMAARLEALADRCSDMEMELSDLRQAMRATNSQQQGHKHIINPGALSSLATPSVPSYAAPLKSQSPRAPITPRDAKPFALSLPSSVRVSEIPRVLAPADLLAEMKSRTSADGKLGFPHNVPTVTPTGGAHNPNFRELQKIMCSSVYNIVEAVVTLCQADSGRIMTKQYPPEASSVSRAPEMVSICNVGERLRFPPSLVRQQCEGSVAASVLATGVALHQRTLGSSRSSQRNELSNNNGPPPLNTINSLIAELNGSAGKAAEATPAGKKKPTRPSSPKDATNRAGPRGNKNDSNVLVFPIRKPIADSGISHPEFLSSPMQQPSSATDAAKASNIIAVLVIENKAGGGVPFTAVDENLCNMSCRILGEIMARMPAYALDWSANFFDPIPLHVVSPFAPFSSTPAQAVDGSFFITEAKNASNDGGATPLGNRLQQHAAEQLIRRTVIQPISATSTNTPRGEKQSTTTVFGGDNTTASALSTTSAVAGLGQAPTLREVDAFLANLHDCWQQTVRTVVDQQQVEHKRHSEMKAVREELIAAKKKIADLENTLRLHKLDASEYKSEYSNLHQELQTYLRKKARTDDE